MVVRRLTIQSVRNFQTGSWDLAPITVIHGRNGAGKTTLVEALALLSTGESFRASKIEEVIQLGQELGRVTAEIEHADNPDVENQAEVETLELLLTRGLVQGRRTQSRLYSVNGIRRRKRDFLDHLATVVFRPEDMRLIEGSPARRRTFMDTALAGLDAQYAQALNTYDKTLKTRNRLLQLVQTGQQPRTTLSYWNQALVKHGELLQHHRLVFLEFLRSIGFALSLSVTYQPSVISEARAAEYLEREIAAGHTLIGPHKDDFVVTFPGKLVGLSGAAGEEPQPISAYGSRGQQRLAVLWLKLGELQFVQQKLAQPPVLLLDDVLSELDHHSRAIVFEWLPKYQSILTTADHELLGEIRHRLPGAKEIELAAESEI
jgi:DNA replication and repair protein RecF